MQSINFKSPKTSELTILYNTNLKVRIIYKRNLRPRGSVRRPSNVAAPQYFYTLKQSLFEM